VRSVLRRGAWLVLLMFLATACTDKSSPAGGGSGSSTTGRTPQFEVPDLHLQESAFAPVDLVFQPTAYRRARRYLDYVEGTSLYACLKRKGFAVDAGAIQVPLVVEVGEPDLDQRREVGYGLLEQGAPSVVDPASTVNGVTVDEATFGGPTDVVAFNHDGLQGQARIGGCRGEVLRALYGDAATYLDFDSTQSEAHNSSVAMLPESEREPVRLRWVQCMSRRGHSYADQSMPKTQLQAELQSTGPTPDFATRERSIAVDDGACVVESQLPSLRRDAAMQYLDGLSAAQRAALDSATQLLITSLQRAPSLLEDARHALSQ